jgi:hypothetical protein
MEATARYSDLKLMLKAAFLAWVLPFLTLITSTAIMNFMNERGLSGFVSGGGYDYSVFYNNYCIVLSASGVSNLHIDA